MIVPCSDCSVNLNLPADEVDPDCVCCSRCADKRLSYAMRKNKVKDAENNRNQCLPFYITAVSLNETDEEYLSRELKLEGIL